MGLTTDPKDPRLGRGADTQPVKQNEAYLVLSEEERAKGFVKPYRTSYIHTGLLGPKWPLRDLTPEEQRGSVKYAKYEEYPESERPLMGRMWTQDELDRVGKGCGTLTKMNRAISETYARDPHFYGATYCVGCSMHRPLNEFRWEDGEPMDPGHPDYKPIPRDPKENPFG